VVEIEEAEIAADGAQDEPGLGLVGRVAAIVLAESYFNHEPHEAVNIQAFQHTARSAVSPPPLPPPQSTRQLNNICGWRAPQDMRLPTAHADSGFWTTGTHILSGDVLSTSNQLRHI